MLKISVPKPLRKKSVIAKIFNDDEIPIQGNTENGEASDEKNFVAGVTKTKIDSKTSSDPKTKAHNLRSRTRIHDQRSGLCLSQ